MAHYGYLLPTRGAVLGSDDPATLAAKAQADVVGLAVRAEALGFRSAWVGDSVLAKPRLDAVTTLAAVGAATDGLDLGTAVHLPGLRHPVNFAHRTATLDQLSGGRLRLGVGVGIGEDVEAEYANLDLDFATRGARLDETLAATRALWGGEAVDFDGDHVSLSGASIGFGPASPPPVYVASAAFDVADGFPRRIRERLADHGDGWLPIGVDPDDYPTGLENARDALKAAGRDPAALDPALYLDVLVGDREAVLEQAKAFHRAYYPARPDPTDEYLLERGAMGAREDVAATLEAYREAGVETFVVRFPTGDQRTQLRRFSALAL